MATIKQMKNLLNKELSPPHSKMENMITKYNDQKVSVNFFSDKYDDLLNQIKQSHEKVQQQKIELGKFSLLLKLVRITFLNNKSFVSCLNVINCY